MSSNRPSRGPEFGRPDAQEFAIGKKIHRVANVAPLDVNGVRTMLVGTVLWGIAAVVMLPFWSALRENGRTWWLWTAFAGFGLGLLGLEYCRSRLNNLQGSEGEAAPAVQSAKKSWRPNSKQSASKRLMDISGPESRDASDAAPDKSSLARKHGALSQSTNEAIHGTKPGQESEANDPEPHVTPPEPGRPVGRRRKPEPEEGS